MNSGIAERRKTPFFQTGNELLDVFEPIVGSDCFTIYSLFARRQFRDPELEHSVQELASTVGLGAATVSRALEILESLGLIELIRCGGSQKSKCRLLDSEAAAVRLGAKYHRNTMRWSLEKETKQQLITEVKAIRQRQQGKVCQKVPTGCGHLSSAEPKGTWLTHNKPCRSDTKPCRSDTLEGSLRDTRVSPQIRQPASRERKGGIHLIHKEVRREEGPTPTPSHKELNEPVNDPAKEQEWLLKTPRSAFNAIIDDLKVHILYPSTSQNRNLRNDSADWDEFGFGGWALESVVRHGSALVLTVSALDLVAAHRGFEKYKRKWALGVRDWLGCDVQIRFSRR